MEYVDIVLASVNILLLTIYLVPKLKRFRGYMFLSLIIANSFFLMSDKLIIPMMIMILSFIFEFFLFKINFKNSFRTSVNTKIYYVVRVFVLFIMLGVGTAGILNFEKNKFQIIDFANNTLSEYDIILLFLTLFLLLNGIVGRKKWIG